MEGLPHRAQQLFALCRHRSRPWRSLRAPLGGRRPSASRAPPRGRRLRTAALRARSRSNFVRKASGSSASPARRKARTVAHAVQPAPRRPMAETGAPHAPTTPHGLCAQDRRRRPGPAATTTTALAWAPPQQGVVVARPPPPPPAAARAKAEPTATATAASAHQWFLHATGGRNATRRGPSNKDSGGTRVGGWGTT